MACVEEEEKNVLYIEWGKREKKEREGENERKKNKDTFLERLKWKRKEKNWKYGVEKRRERKEEGIIGENQAIRIWTGI